MSSKFEKVDKIYVSTCPVFAGLVTNIRTFVCYAGILHGRFLPLDVEHGVTGQLCNFVGKTASSASF